MSDFTELERLIHRLAEIYDEMCELPKGPSERRAVLLGERDRLRTDASLYHSAADEAKARERLQAELEALKRRRDELLRERTGLARTGGRTPGGWMEFSDQVGSAPPGPSIDSRICAVDDLLAGPATTPDV